MPGCYKDAMDFTKHAINPSEMEDRRREMAQLVRGLRPDRELFSGRHFFELLLKYYDVEGVINFVERNKDVKGGLDLHFNFTPEEQDLFDQTQNKILFAAWRVWGARRRFCGHGIRSEWRSWCS